MRIATWNVNSLKVRLPHVLQWLEAQQPDVLGLQETKTVDDAFPVDELREVGYQVVFSGQPTYNGVALLSRTPATDVVRELPGFPDSQRRVLGATVAGFRIFNLYVPNGQSVDSDKYRYKLQWLAHLTALLEKEHKTHELLIAMGDFNIAPEDRDVHDPEAWRGQVLCSTPEREAFGRLLGTGLVDLFRQQESGPGHFTWWDYRAAAFRRNMGLRIDHVLGSRAVAGRCTACTIDPAPRRWERPSDHTPVFADIGPV